MTTEGSKPDDEVKMEDIALEEPPALEQVAPEEIERHYRPEVEVRGSETYFEELD